jgi:hypothetical protein
MEEIFEKKPKSDLKSKFRLFFAREIFRNPLFQWQFIVAIFLNAVAWALVVIFIRPAKDYIWLHYNVYFGVDVIGDWWQAYIIPGMGLFFFLINLFLAIYFFGRKERMASHLLMLASILIQAGIIIAEIPVIIINSTA